MAPRGSGERQAPAATEAVGVACGGEVEVEERGHGGALRGGWLDGHTVPLPPRASQRGGMRPRGRPARSTGAVLRTAVSGDRPTEIPASRGGPRRPAGARRGLRPPRRAL